MCGLNAVGTYRHHQHDSYCLSDCRQPAIVVIRKSPLFHRCQQQRRRRTKKKKNSPQQKLPWIDKLYQVICDFHGTWVCVLWAIFLCWVTWNRKLNLGTNSSNCICHIFSPNAGNKLKNEDEIKYKTIYPFNDWLWTNNMKTGLRDPVISRQIHYPVRKWFITSTDKEYEQNTQRNGTQIGSFVRKVFLVERHGEIVVQSPF